MLFNAQAFVSTMIFIVLLAPIYFGAVFATYHKWFPVRVIGMLVASLALATLIAHVVALFAGA